MDEIKQFLETSYESIRDYLIDKEIEIKEEDPFIEKSEKYLIKYKRLIGLVLLIILILIPYFCFGDDDEIIQSGGTVEEEAEAKEKAERAAKARALLTDKMADKVSFATAKKQIQTKQREDKLTSMKTEREGRYSKGLISGLTKAKDAEGQYNNYRGGIEKGAQNEKYKREEKKQEKRDKQAARIGEISEKIGKYKEKGSHLLALDKFNDADTKGKKAAAAFTSASRITGAAGKKVYNLGAYAGEKVKENAEWFYGILYTIAMAVAIFLLVVPSIAFFAVGIMCYFLLKGKIGYFKSL